MYKILLRPEAIGNLRILLERVNLTGKEVAAYIEILQALDKAEKEGD